MIKPDDPGTRRGPGAADVVKVQDQAQRARPSSSVAAASSRNGYCRPGE
jgi:hypothetical protein